MVGVKVPDDSDRKSALTGVAPKLFINGQFVDADNGKTFPVEDPRTGEVLVHVAEAAAADVDRAVKAARQAFDEGPWPRMSGRARGRVLYKLADLVEQNAQELATLESLDNGKPFQTALQADVALSVEHLRYYAGWADKICGQTIPVEGNMQALTYREPLGVVGQIIPWNFPLLMLAWKLGPALAGGNCLVVKVAEQTPLSALRVAALFEEAGLPAGVVNILPGYGETAGAALTAHPGINKLAFTGSTEVGRLIMKAAADNIVPVTLELGGKSPCIVCEDADLDLAVELAAFAIFFNHGQCCTAGSRTYVHESIYDEFVKRATERAQRIKVGDPFDQDTEQGPQVSREQFDKILDYVVSGEEEGARLETGGRQHGEQGYFVQPAVFSNVKDHMKIAREEIFGPVQSIFSWRTLDEVIKRANDTTYGLAAGVFTKDINKANCLARALRAGTVWVNTWNQFDAGVPFGGCKASGIGREHGEAALSHYTQFSNARGKPTWKRMLNQFGERLTGFTLGQVKSVYVPLVEPIAWKM